MTHSKSSLGLLPAGIAAGLVYRIWWKYGIDRLIVAIAGCLVGVIVLALLAADWNAIAHLLEDPTQFTGRAAIWQGEIAFIRDHPLLGSGYGTFADTGAASPLRNYVGDAWVQNVSHGHNAYLQLFVTIGGVGIALSVLALILLPLRAFLLYRGPKTEFVAPLFAVFIFMITHDMLESDFLEGDSPAWVAFLVVLAAFGAVRKPSSPESERVR
jgi:O-antigen ligase